MTLESVERAEQHIVESIADFQQAIRAAQTPDDALDLQRRLEALEMQIGLTASRALGRAYELHS